MKTKKKKNTEELVSFVDWRRILGMPGEKRIVVESYYRVSEKAVL